MRQLIATSAMAMVILLGAVWGAGSADAGSSSPACPFVDSETATECQITAAWTIGGGGVGANNFPAPLPGPFAFHKDLHILNGGSIRALGTAGITITIDGANGGTGALIMDAGTSVIETNEDLVPPNDGAGAISITAAGGAQTTAGSTIRSQNTLQGGAGGPITLILGATSTLAGTISSEALAGTTSNNGGDIAINVTGDLTIAAGGVINSQKHADSGRSGHIAITVSGDMLMQGGNPGALITSEHPDATNGTAGGNITIAVGTGDLGTFTMEQGSRVDSSSQGRAGNIKITAGDEIEIEADASVLAGQRATQDTQGKGGRIFVIAGCQATILGTLSSQGRDPGADLVHVEGCEVRVGPNALIESTGSAHQPSVPTSCDGTDDAATEPGGDAGEVFRPDHPDTSSVCVEIWGRHITIDAGGEINANFALDGGTQGHGWIDIFAEQDVIINGPAAAPFAVHSNSELGTDVGGDVRVAAKNAFVTATGLALQASAPGNGSDGGTISVHASGLVTLDGATLEAAGDNVGDGNGGAPGKDPCDPSAFSGACGEGGEITVQSHNSAISWTNGVGNVNPDIGPAPPAGSVALTACTTVTTTGTNFDNATPTVNQGAGCASVVPIPAYVTFNPGGRWDRCGESTISGHKLDGRTEGPLPGWTIHITGPGVDLTMVTDQNGFYSFTVPGGQTYKICEVLQAGWEQTFPTGPAPGIVPCTGPGEAPWGHEVPLNQGGACCDGQHVTGKDFVNHERRVDECQKQTVNDVMDATYPNNAGPDKTVRTWLGESVQAAVDAAADTNGDNYIIVMVVAKSDFSLGGSANQKVAVSRSDYAKPFGLFGCSVTLTGGGTGPAVWVKSPAASPQINVNGKPTTIFVMDLHGGNSAVGVQADGTKRYLRNEDATGNTTGIVINGSSNTLHNGSAEKNGAGIVVTGNSNTLTDTDIFSNTGVGVSITGNTNTVTKLDAGDAGKGNGGDGFYVRGNGNQLTENEALANKGDGFDIGGGTAAAANVLKKNVAGDRNVGNNGNGFALGTDTGSGTSNPLELEQNTAQANGLNGFLVNGGGHQLKNNVSGNSGTGYDNGDCEFKAVTGNFNATGNKSNNVTVAGANNSAFSTACIGTP